MIILNSVNDFKSSFLKKLFEIKGVTYINLEYSNNKSLKFSQSSTSLVYIYSPVSDIDRHITKNLQESLNKSEEGYRKNIFVASHNNSPFSPENIFDINELEGDFERPNILITNPYDIVRFIDELCPSNTLFDTDLKKRYMMHDECTRFYRDVFEKMFDVEKMLLRHFGQENGYAFKKILMLEDLKAGNNHVKGALNRVFDLLKEINVGVQQRKNKKFFFYDYISPFDILFFCLIDRLIELNQLDESDLDQITRSKYRSLNKEINSLNSGVRMVSYKNLSKKLVIKNEI